jgi:HAD superfamily hydrolase (TIGR01509 family)
VDFDGTLVDSLDELYLVYLGFLEHYGHRGSREEFQELNGPSILQVIDILAKRYHLEHDKEVLAQVYWAKLRDFYARNAQPLPGATEWLDQVSAYGLKLAIVTAAGRELVEGFLQHHRLSRYFQAIVTAEEVLHSKPDPAMFHLAMHKLGVKAQETVAIEDAPSGVQAAAAAGIFVIQLNPTALRSHQVKPSVEVDDWNAIKHLFKEWYEPFSSPST